MNLLLGTCFVFLTALTVAYSSRVLELSDKFIDIHTDGVWFVKFYAPWCAHCRRLEPVWAHVAQTLYSSPIRIAKVDCTRFPTVATHFKIRAYPTMLFIKGSHMYEYGGERVKEDMVNYALRMSESAVQKIDNEDSIGFMKETHPVFFGFIGNQQGYLWDMFSAHAEKYQPHSWFFTMTYELVKNDLNPPNETAVFVFKEDEAFFFEATPELIDNKDTLNTTLDKWINAERFGSFPKITRSNINDLLETEKNIVMVVVSENKLSEVSQTERDFKDMVEGVVKKRKREYHEHFQFGWLGTIDIANSIAMSELTVPHLLVLNSTTSHHHMPDDDPVLMTPEAVQIFLDQIHNQQAPFYGGNSLPVRVYRGFYETKTTLVSMWRGNPVLTALVFGLPLGFLSLICYSVCCADILDADEEEVEDTHEKKD